MNTSTNKRKLKIGDILVQNEIISDEQLRRGLDHQRQTGAKLGRALIELGFIEENHFLEFLSQQMELPFIDLKQFNFDRELIQRLTETHARRHRALVLSENKGVLTVGMADPMDIYAYDELSRILQQNIEVAIVRESELLSTLDLVYRRTEDIASFAEELDEEITEGQFDLADLTVSQTNEDAPVVKMLQSIFEDAVQVRASDIHIEPDETVLRIRQRVDGVLQEQVMKEKRISSALVLRLKLMSGLNISEKRLPQDGRFSLIVKKRKLDVRVSTMPIENGESVVMRLLDQSAGSTNLDQVGMTDSMLKEFRRTIHMPHGLVLVTGPTGSGKTTTLYGALSELNAVGKKIITAEDPVEYRMERINQVQINTKIGLDFSKILRAALRQDPDIILVGEIRDSETAEIALRAAMTGHLVLSTLHTNDAISSAMRLVDMGAEGFLAATALRAVVAQRLVRRLCDNCAVPHEIGAQEKGWLDAFLSPEQKQGMKLFDANGCHRCNNTGYRGRIGAFELLILNDAMSDALRREDAQEFIDLARKSPTYKPLVVTALEYATQGVTSLSEVYRVAEQVDESPDFQQVKANS